MKPINLVINAFGSFSEMQTINFENINKNSIFLITGPTGCGKTTIFDSICFALYGEASNETKKSITLKSDYANKKDICYVELTFTIKNKIYKIRRDPQQLKINRNGDESYVSEKVLLTLDNQQEIVGIKDVNSKIIEIIGISKKQFKKIVMLPQGDFKNLLESKSDEKQEIFRKIFSTEIFEEFTWILKEKLKDIVTKLNKIKDENNIHISGIHCLNNPILHSNILEDTKIYSNIIKLLKLHIDSNETDLKLQKTELEEILIKKEMINLESIKEINDKFELLEKVTRSLELLNRDYKSIENAISNLKKLENMKELISIETNINEHEKQKLNLESNINVSKNEQADYETSLLLSDENLSNIPQMENEIEKISKSIDLKETILKNLELKEKLTTDMENQNQILKTYLKKKENNMILKERLNKKTIYDSKIKKYNLISKIKEDILKYSEASNEQKDISNNYENILNNYKKNIHYIIASELKDNNSCPVCGSLEHPNIAKTYSVKISESELKNSKKMCDEAISKKIRILSDIKKNLNELNIQSLNKYYENIDILLGENELKKLDEIESEVLEELESFEKDILIIEDKIRKTISKNILKVKEIDDRDILEENELKNYREIECANIKLKNFNDELENLNKNTPYSINEKDNLHNVILNDKKNIENLKINIEDIKKTNKYIKDNIKIEQNNQKNLNKQLFVVKENIDLYNNNFLNKLNSYNFQEKCEFDKFKKDNKLENIDQNINNLKYTIDSYNKNKSREESKKDILESQLKNKKKIDLNLAKKDIEDLKLEYDKINNNCMRLTSSIDKNKEILKKITTNESDINKLEKKYNLINELSQLSCGNNLEKISFERFILASYFDEVINSANEILYEMTNSRFKLSRKKIKEKGNTPSGLDLEVFDSYTGRYRESSTLSGGESFITSISLAIGLSDIISRHQGGIQLGTMFIDEGFGTLDSNSLDNVLMWLMKLQSSGRIIGIISHVQELKDKINTKIVVTPSRKGSSIDVQL